MKRLLPKVVVTSIVTALLISVGSISYGEGFSYTCTPTWNVKTIQWNFQNNSNFKYIIQPKNSNNVDNTSIQNNTPNIQDNITNQDNPEQNTNTNTNTVEQGSQTVEDQTTQDNTTSNVSNSVRAMETKVIELVNAERAKVGLSPLTENVELSKVARIKSQDMIDKNYFSHTSPTYGSPFDMMKNFGISYKTAGENIAAGYSTPEAVVNGWMNSEGHRANILSSSFNKIGVGYAVDKNGKAYWTQMFTD